MNEVAEGEDEDALFCDGDISGIRVDGGKLGIYGHRQCDRCDILVRSE
jgi:hypothetical protein